MFRIGFAALFMVIACSVQAMNVAYVNMEKLFEEYHETKDADAKLKAQRELIKDSIKSFGEELKQLDEKYRQLRDDSTNIALSETERATKRESMKDTQKLFIEKRKEVEQYQKQKMREVQESYEKSRDAVIAKLSKIIKSWAANKGYDLILDISGKTLNGISGIIYYDESKDITGTLLKAVNAGYEKKDK